MTDASSIQLVNCGKKRHVLLYVQNDTEIKMGDPVNEISESPCDNRVDDQDAETIVTKGHGQFESDHKLRPYCTVESCRFCTKER